MFSENSQTMALVLSEERQINKNDSMKSNRLTSFQHTYTNPKIFDM